MTCYFITDFFAILYLNLVTIKTGKINAVKADAKSVKTNKRVAHQTTVDKCFSATQNKKRFFQT